MVKSSHFAPHVVRQRVVIRRRGRSLVPHGQRRKSTTRARQTEAVAQSFGRYWARSDHAVRPDAQLTSDQLWAVYCMNGDVRAAVDSIGRRVSTTDWRVVPTEDPAGDDLRFREGLRQSTYCTRRLQEPAEDETWQTFWMKLVIDALVFFYGLWENAYGRRLDPRTMEIVRGSVREFVPVYAPSTHPITDEHNRITGWEHHPGMLRGRGKRGRTVELDKSQIGRLMLAPNNRSQYGVPLIETVIREITTLVRASERTMYVMDRDEHPEGFLVLTGVAPKQADHQRDEGEAHAGQPHKVRVIHTMGASAPATWLKIERDFTEIAYAEVVEKSRRVIWRVFGVTPIEMGETEGSNRANSQVQVEVGDSHLVEPTLEAIAQIVNSQMLPLLLEAMGVEEHLCRFEWQPDESLTPEEEKDAAEAAKIRTEAGITTINEERTRRGDPRVDNGDVVRVGNQPLGSQDTATDGATTGDDDGDDGGDDGGGADGGSDGDGGVDSGDAEAENDEEDADRALEALKLAELAAALESRRQRRAAALLPSDWQPEGRFRDVRTIDLGGLFDLVTAYRETVDPLWARAKREILAHTSAAWRRGTVGSSDHRQQVDATIRALRTEWSAATQPLYVRAAELGVASARDLAQVDGIGDGAEQRGLTYHEAAMAYLNDLLDQVKARVIVNVNAVRASARPDPSLGPDSELDDLLEVLEHGIDAEEHRIDNWSGRLVELANAAALASMLEASTVAGGPDAEAADVDDEDTTGAAGGGGGAGAGATEWWVAWEYVGDERMCATCEREGALPIRPLSQLPTTPGGATECRARCRCVLVYWTKREVQDGSAARVNG